MKKIRWPIAFMAVAVLALALPLIANANHTWSKYHWDIASADPQNQTLAISENLSGKWDSSFASASADWNASVLKHFVLPNGTNSACIPVLGRVEVCNADYGNTGWLGIAQV